MATVAESVTTETMFRTPIYFPRALPGLDGRHSFTLIEFEGLAVYHLVSDDDPGVVLPVAEAGVIIDDYSVELSDAEAAELGIERAEDATLLLVLTIDATTRAASANLLAPIVVSSRTRMAQQLILDGSGYPLRHPIDWR